MDLYHRTNELSYPVCATDIDDEIDFRAIWTQFAYREGGCCHGFGVSKIRVIEDDFVSEHDGYWRIFLVSQRHGHNYDHFFYKFAAIPEGTWGQGLRSASSKGWTHVGDINARNAIQDLRSLLKPYQSGEMYYDSDYGIVYHIHIALMMDVLYPG